MSADDGGSAIPHALLASPSARAMLRDASDAAKTAMALWKLKLYKGTKGSGTEAAQVAESAKQEETETTADEEVRNESLPSAPSDEDQKHFLYEDSSNMISSLEPIAALFFVDPTLIQLQSSSSPTTIDRDSIDAWSKDDKYSSLCHIRTAVVEQIFIIDLTSLIVLNDQLRDSVHTSISAPKSPTTTTTRREVFLGREYPSPQNCADEVKYVQYGIVTKHISAVIEIGEEGSHKAGAAGNGCDDDGSSADSIDKAAEVIVMKHIASDTSDMIMGSEPHSTCASTSNDLASSSNETETDGVASQQTGKSTQEAEDKANNVDVGASGSAYSMASIESIKAEVANALIKLSCSTESYEDKIIIEEKAQKKPQTPAKNTVQFAETIVSEVRERPRIDPEVVRELFYSMSDIERFEDEADESTCEGSSIGASFSYTVTPTPSYLAGDEETGENDTPVATEPTKSDKVIGSDHVVTDGMIAAYESLLAQFSNMNISTNGSDKNLQGSENGGGAWPNNGAHMPFAEV